MLSGCFRDSVRRHVDAKEYLETQTLRKREGVWWDESGKKGKEDESDSSAETVETLTVGSLRLWAHLFGHGEENVVTRVLYAASGKNCLRRSRWRFNGPMKSLKYFKSNGKM